MTIVEHERTPMDIMIMITIMMYAYVSLDCIRNTSKRYYHLHKEIMLLYGNGDRGCSRISLRAFIELDGGHTCIF